MFLPLGLLIILVLSNNAAYAWGVEGHALVADIAEASLNPAAKKQVQALLALEQHRHLDEVASWADHTPPRSPLTSPWHYVAIPLQAEAYVEQRDCQPHSCVINKIADFAEQLADKNADAQQRLEALKWLVHFIGDLHQPLHAGNNADHGGNDVKLPYFGKDSNFHKVWDSDILEQALDLHSGKDFSFDHIAVQKIADQQLALIASQDPTDWLAHDTLADIKLAAETWAQESHGLAQKAYAWLPTERSADWENSYQQNAWPVVQIRLQQAGVRLAGLLNQVFLQ